jgi:hypothetical protein
MALLPCAITAPQRSSGRASGWSSTTGPWAVGGCCCRGPRAPWPPLTCCRPCGRWALLGAAVPCMPALCAERVICRGCCRPVRVPRAPARHGRQAADLAPGLTRSRGERRCARQPAGLLGATSARPWQQRGRSIAPQSDWWWPAATELATASAVAGDCCSSLVREACLQRMIIL